MLKACFHVAERLLNQYGYQIRWLPPIMNRNRKAELPFELEFVIAHLMLQKRDIFFLEIGANDGISNDPLYHFIMRHHWKGILVEPIPEVFDVLTKNFEDRPDLKFINAAIGAADGFQTLYTVKIDSSTFAKAHQYSSFRKDVVKQQTQWVPDIADRITETQVKVISFDTLIAEAGENEIDVVLIDTEGYDYELLKMMDFHKMKPSLICYEHCNLNKAERSCAAELLIGQGYRLTSDDLDTIAYRPSATYGFRL